MADLKAVGITHTGMLLPIRSVNSVRGMSLCAIIVSAKYEKWFRRHEKVLRETFAWWRGLRGMVTILTEDKT